MRHAVIDDLKIDLHIGRRLRSRRTHLGLTQAQVAVSVGVRFQQIQKYECAANRISAARLWLLAYVLEVPPSYFFDGLNSLSVHGLLNGSGAHDEDRIAAL